MQKRKVTLDTIANELGITKVTVSKALNNQPGVSEELKKRIIELSGNLGYVNRKEKTDVRPVVKLGILVPKRFFLDTDNFYTRIYYYMNRECALQNITLALYILNPEEELNVTYPLALTQDQVELSGLFIAGEVSSEYLRALIALSLPIVAIDFYKSDLHLDYVVTDNYRSGTLVTTYLIEKGHKQIGFVGDPKFTSSVMDRYCGYIKALTQHELEWRKQWHIVNNDEHGKYHLDFDLPDPLPTAFVCHCDMAAYKLILKLQTAGIHVPNDVSLISFDNTELSQSIVPALTTMNIDKSQIAIMSLKRMLWRLQHPSEETQFFSVNATLIERDSVAKK